VDQVTAQSLDAARALHRAGRLAEAEEAYSALLDDHPGDADLAGLMGVLALQRDRPAEAEARLRQALALCAGAPTRLRNLNNLVVALRKTDKRAEASEALESRIPDWPAGAAAEGPDRETVLSLVEALIGYGKPEKARRLLDQAIPARDTDAQALNLDGRLRLAEGTPEDAVDLLERAAALVPRDRQPLIALSCAQAELDLTEAARATARRVALLAPTCAADPRSSQRATILMLNPWPRQIRSPNASLRSLHFSANYPGQIAGLLRDEFRFLSVFGDLPPSEVSGDLPQPDIVLNNIVNSEPMNVPGRLETVSAHADGPGCPVINHPRQVFDATRQKNALHLAGAPNVRVPAIARYQLATAGIEAIVADISQRFAYPLILREVGAHMSAYSLLPGHRQTAVLIDSPAAIRAHLEAARWPEFYAVEFIDLKMPGGYYRKIRVIFADDEIIVSQGGYLDQWMVSGWRYRPIGIEFYRRHPECIEDLRRIVRDPAGTLGRGFMETLAVIRDRIPLDLFGLDCDFDSQGRVVFFEAGAAMAFLELQAPVPELALPTEPYERINDAFRRMVDRRMGGG